jgi:hypothetical protein
MGDVRPLRVRRIVLWNTHDMHLVTLDRACAWCLSGSFPARIMRRPMVMCRMKAAIRVAQEKPDDRLVSDAGNDKTQACLGLNAVQHTV